MGNTNSIIDHIPLYKKTSQHDKLLDDIDNILNDIEEQQIRILDDNNDKKFYNILYHKIKNIYKK